MSGNQFLQRIIVMNHTRPYVNLRTHLSVAQISITIKTRHCIRSTLEPTTQLAMHRSTMEGMIAVTINRFPPWSVGEQTLTVFRKVMRSHVGFMYTILHAWTTVSAIQRAYSHHEHYCSESSACVIPSIPVVMTSGIVMICTLLDYRAQ